MNFLLYIMYYWLLLKRLIMMERWVMAGLSAIVFSAIKSLYDKYLVTFLASQTDWFGVREQQFSGSRFKLIGFHIDFAYAMNSSFLIMVGCAYVIKSIQQKEVIQQIKHSKLLSELVYLRAQLQPHFFFNTLNNIYGMAMKQSAATAPMISRLSEMMRYIIYKADGEQISLSQEVDFISNYVEIERIRYAQETDISFETQGDIDLYQIEPLLLLPLVENAFKHGLGDGSSEGKVRILLCVYDGQIHLELENSLAQNTKPAEGGVGLSNLRKRLALLYPERHELIIKNDGNTYFTSLSLFA
ncbi:sensor histidine kinase [Pedobacter faecalis]|uniref:sensor histidine kinase n=1 Tax=Pedobacter faecalis TaxID=3041495 RepID=UPI00254A0958|nr:sensor histidine kinase [Pedobacter sp. ELA7]